MGHLTSHATQALNCSAQRGRHSLMWLVRHSGTSWRNSSNLNSWWRVITSRCYYYPQVRKIRGHETLEQTLPLKQNAGVIWWFVTQTFRLRGKRMTELERDISKKEKKRILWARTGDHDSVNLTIMKNCEEKMNRKLLTRTQILQSDSKKTGLITQEQWI